MKKISTLFLLIFSLPIFLKAQQTVSVFGTVTEGGTAAPIEFAIVFVKETGKNVETNAAGEYAINVPSGRNLTLQVRRIGYKEAKIALEPMRAGTQRRIDVALVDSSSQQEVVIKDTRLKDNGMVREDIKDFRLLPTTTGNLESVRAAN
jgi:CarboxypepD_reg-like domain